jgi:two-component sensor histidine kinase
MHNQQYNRQKLYYRWSLVLCILALIGYTVYFLFERYINDVGLFSDNKAFFLRLSLILYFTIILVVLDKLPEKIFNLLGFIIVVPLGWMISLISYLTIGYEGITVTGFIFLILASAVVFDFTLPSFSIALLLILTFHFVLLSFYPERQPIGELNHIFLLGMSGILGLTINFLVNAIKENETKVLKEREMLLKEIHHRVKNNLQIISSLLNLQTSSITDGIIKAAVLESQNRVKTMALIHQLLYESDRFSSIDFPKYLGQLLFTLHESYKNPDKNISYDITTDEIRLDIDRAVPLGLITNELVTNAYKYAFKNIPEGRIEIGLRKIPDGRYSLTISDNGTGLPETFDLDHTNTLGLKLVRLLTEQIDGELEITNDGGAAFTIFFNGMPKN